MLSKLNLWTGSRMAQQDSLRISQRDCRPAGRIAPAPGAGGSTIHPVLAEDLGDPPASGRADSSPLESPDTVSTASAPRVAFFLGGRCVRIALCPLEKHPEVGLSLSAPER